MPPKRKPTTDPKGEDAGSTTKKIKPDSDAVEEKENLEVIGRFTATLKMQDLPTVVVASLGEGVNVFSIPAREITQEVSEALELAAGGHRDNCEGPQGDALEKVWDWCTDPEAGIHEGSAEADLKEKQRREEMGYGKFWRYRFDEKSGPSATTVIIKQDA